MSAKMCTDFRGAIGPRPIGLRRRQPGGIKQIKFLATKYVVIFMAKYLLYGFHRISLRQTPTNSVDNRCISEVSLYVSQFLDSNRLGDLDNC